MIPHMIHRGDLIRHDGQFALVVQVGHNNLLLVLNGNGTTELIRSSAVQPVLLEPGNPRAASVNFGEALRDGDWRIDTFRGDQMPSQTPLPLVNTPDVRS